MFITLTRKLVLSVSLLLGLLILSAGWGLHVVQRVHTAVDELTHESVAEILANEAYARDIRQALSEAQSYARTGDVDERQEAEAALAATAKQLAALRTQGEHDQVDPALYAAHMAAYTQRSDFYVATDQTITRLVDAVAAEDADGVAAGLDALERAEDAFADLEANVADEATQDVNTSLTEAVRPIRAIQVTLLVGATVVALLLLLSVLLLYRVVIRPVTQLSHHTIGMAQGAQLTDVVVTSRDEIGVLQQAINALLATIRTQARDLTAQVTTAERARRAAEQAHAVVQDQLATIAAQQQVIQDMSVPVLPLSATTLVMPLVGALDTTRLAQMQAQALAAVEQASARHLLIDVTGVSVIDTQVAQGLLQLVQALRLLGAEALLVGMRPEVAQTIVGLGLDLRTVATEPSLEGGVARVLTSARKQRHRTIK